MPRELGEFSPGAQQSFLRLTLEERWEILEALQRLADDPNLLDLQEDGEEEFIVAAGYAVGVAVDDEYVDVTVIRKLGTN